MIYNNDGKKKNNTLIKVPWHFESHLYL